MKCACIDRAYAIATRANSACMYSAPVFGRGGTIHLPILFDSCNSPQGNSAILTTQTFVAWTQGT